MTVVSSPTPAPTPAGAAGLLPERATAFLVGIVDDAEAVAPGSTSLADAIQTHRSHRHEPHGLVVGPLLAQVSRLAEVLDALDAHASSDPLDLVLIADTGLVEAAEARAVLLDDDRVELVGLEVALPRDSSMALAAHTTLDSLDFALPAAIELPRAAGWQEALGVIASDGAERVGFRAGGTGEFVPDHDLAEFVHAAVQRGASFKLTTGPGRALRHTDPASGTEHHGFLNVLAATAEALDGRGLEHLVAVIAERDPLPLLAILGDAEPRTVRARFTSFDSDSLGQTIEDMRTLGMLDLP
ncbi:unannotated protein [freshwater metagenome]|uniref:Unannotated protein n=1 Tax=freshwater metagenome TaxID=449393 RepID=A0A6J7QNJ6_9ZZZZ